jgi:LL-diaminopimelate aminotransferase
MVKRNPHFAQLCSSYLFPEINRRKKIYLERYPESKLISLGIGDTTQPIPRSVTEALKKQVEALGTQKGYRGYGPEQGLEELRHEIAEKIYSHRVHSDEVFISDGCLCDIGRLQMLFGSDHTVAIQDPTYPAYLDNSVIIGQAHLKKLILMPCLPENNFFPDFDQTPPAHLIYICSPNNPTGCAASRKQLEKLVAFAKKHRSIIIFDAAYSIYIDDPELPRSIYEIEGAKEVAIELGSFSKIAGFTGVRLGWSIVPKELHFEDGSSVQKDWFRLVTTCFNGASNISQAGGLAVLQSTGWSEIQENIRYYKENASLLKNSFKKMGYDVYGGEHSPFVWVRVKGKSSWEFFEELLEKKQILCVPGSGFGNSGEGFIRLSALGQRSDVEEAIARL